MDNKSFWEKCWSKENIDALLPFGAFALYSLGRYVTQKKSRSVL